MASASRVNRFAGRAEHAHLAPVLERLEADALALVRSRVEQHHVGNVDRSLALDDAARLVGLGVRLRVALDEVHVLHDDLVVEHAQDLALLTLVLAGDHDYLITLADTFHLFALVTALRVPATRSS